MTCKGIIPGTFIACGEGGNYCSEECWEAAKKARTDKQQDVTPEEAVAAIKAVREGNANKAGRTRGGL